MLKPFKTIRKQQGWTFWTLTSVMAVVLLFSYIGLQLVPVYLANDSIRNAMAQSIEGPDPSKINRTLIVRKMKDQLYLDGNHKILKYSTDLKVRRSRSELIVETHYIREVPLFFNVSLLVKFDNVETRSFKG
ncbi:MAG: DUF4845 domain-containing protein [Arenicella sp.]|nr:DUF4845 domain-containing protein [Arenicella sp.]